jgi:hypothetical protein
MTKAILVCVALLSGVASGVADQIETSPGVAEKADMDRIAAFTTACLDATALMLNNQYDQAPLSARVAANVKMCNGHPYQTICDISSRVMLQEYGKTPFTMGLMPPILCP